MQTLTFTCKTITPMFLGGAYPAHAELRATSLKGALRFWWRAMNGDLALPQLKERESLIFGGTNGEAARRSSFSISIPTSGLKFSRKLPVFKVPTMIKGQFRDINVFEYLAYGTYDWDKLSKQNILKRDFIEARQDFDLCMRFSDLLSYNEDVLASLMLVSYFGGIGSKSRNGYGSFIIQHADFDGANYQTLFKKLKSGTQKNFAKFSADAELFETKEFETPELAHGELGKAYKYARENVETRHHYDKRIYLASPLIAEQKTTFSFLDRHAKNFFMSVIGLPNAKYKGLMLYLPYAYLQDGGDVLAKFLKDSRLSSVEQAQAKYTNAASDFINKLKINLTPVK